MKMIKKYPLNQSPLYKLQSKKKLAPLLNVDKSVLRKIEKIITYHTFSQEKADGDERIITAPDEQLKKIQRKVLTLLSRIESPEWVISGKKGKSYIDNATYHIESQYVLTMDIAKFYDNCRREYIYKMFMYQFQMPKDIAKIMTDITTLGDKVPTGAPTSQVLVFHAYKEMFYNINRIAQEHKCQFSLYVDDMTMSSEDPINVAHLTRAVGMELKKYDHKLKGSKIKYYSRRKHKLITGVAITNKNVLAVKNSMRKKIIDDFRALKQNPYDRTILLRLKGRLACARRIEPNIFHEVKRYVDNYKNDAI